MLIAFKPSLRAVSSPFASGLLDMTAAMHAFRITPEAIFLAMVSKLDPRPERSMPRFFMNLAQSTLLYQRYAKRQENSGII